MHKTPKGVFEEIARERPLCERAVFFRDHICSGRSTMEHAFVIAGRQCNEKWSIIRACAWSHLGPGLDKEKHRFLALHHATDADLAKYPKANLGQMKKYLTKKYGPGDTRQKA
jgi:hypothetical protein